MCGDEWQEPLVRVSIGEGYVLVYRGSGDLLSADCACARVPFRPKVAGASQALGLSDLQNTLLRWTCAVSALIGTVCVRALYVPSVKE